MVWTFEPFFLIENGFTRGNIDTTYFVKIKSHDLLIVQIYVDDIIFDATYENLCKDFAKCMQGEFEMSLMRELNYFLRLQIKQCKEGIYINLDKYIKELLKFSMNDSKSATTPMSTSIKLDKDENGKSIDQTKY